MPPTQLSHFHPSPKRKRDNALPAPLLNTNLHNVSTPPTASPEPDSPRNVVANQLEGMTIAGLPAISQPFPPPTPTDDAMRKKPKLAQAMEGVVQTPAETLSESEIMALDKDSLYVAFNLPQTDSAREIPETPQSAVDVRTQTPRTFEDVAKLPQPVVFSSAQTQPPAKQTTARNKPSLKSKSGPAQPRSRKKSPSPPLPSLTWQDSEITGHLVDPSTDPDDDGTGLNGIGFKPTPAIAQARKHKRSKQLQEWRLRQTREERAKRSEKRRRGVGGAGLSSREPTVEREMPKTEMNVGRRAVRFATPTEG